MEYDESKLSNETYRVILDIFHTGVLVSKTFHTEDRYVDWLMTHEGQLLKNDIVRFERGTISSWELITEHDKWL